jgi:gas vesicle protein
MIYPSLVKGLLIGGAAVLLVTSKTLQKGIMKAGVSIYKGIKDSTEEIKEQWEDTKAEVMLEKKKKASK